MGIIIVAVACQWSTGDIVFATSIPSTATAIHKVYNDNEEFINITIDRRDGAFMAPLVFIKNGEKSVKLAKCLIREEK